jgi:hypothetical protein
MTPVTDQAFRQNIFARSRRKISDWIREDDSRKIPFARDERASGTKNSAFHLQTRVAVKPACDAPVFTFLVSRVFRAW